MMQDDGGIIKIGMMTKRAQQKRSIGPINYKERVFVLTKNKLSYYEGTLKERGKIKGSFNISSISFIGPIIAGALGRTSVFQIIHDDGVILYCCATSQADREEWINAIAKECRAQGQELSTFYHPSIYQSGKWQCCGNSEKSNKGCKHNEKYNKPLPSSPLNSRLKVHNLQQGFPISQRRNTFDQQMFGGSMPIAPGPLSSVEPGASFEYPVPRLSNISENVNKFMPGHKNARSSHNALPPIPLQPSPPPLPKINPQNQNDSFLNPQLNAQIQNKFVSNFTAANTPPSHVLPSVAPKPKRPPRKDDNIGPAYPTKTNTLSNTFKGVTTLSNPPRNIIPVVHQQAAPLPRPSIPSTEVEQIVVAIYNFQPQEYGDIALIVGESYTVIETSRAHWWKVRNSYGESGFVPSNYVKDQKKINDLENQSWFQRDMSRSRAETLLIEDGKEGTFVIRNSTQPSVVYTLSLVSKGGIVNGQCIVKHYHIKKNTQGMFYLSEKKSMSTIMELIEYHRHNAAGLICRLRQPPDSIKPALPVNPDLNWEIDINDIEMMQELGSGQFGVVNMGKIRGKQQIVAVKVMKEGTMEEENFIEEAEVMKKIDHPNLVKLYGVVTKVRPICIVTEFMEGGCLLDYIRKHKQLQNHPDDLLDMCYQICDAMKYLEANNLIHRDLAARNCLVGKNKTIKVADFGLTRFVLDDEYTSSLGSKFPIKWAAPEVLNYTKFSSKSDVWAFGVLTWELFSGGMMPYRALSNNEVVEKVANGLRLQRPQSCPHNVYDLMKQTWDIEPENRPPFERLFFLFNDLIDDVRVRAGESMYDA